MIHIQTTYQKYNGNKKNTFSNIQGHRNVIEKVNR